MHRLPDIRTYRGKVYRYLMYRYMQYREQDAVLKIFNEGSSRSGKTYDAFDFLYDICTLALSPLNIFVYRNTAQACKEITLADFRKKLTLRGVYDPDAMRSEKQRPDYYINNSVIHFRGSDRMDSREGHDCDIIYINEMLDDISKQQYKNITMRCTTMVIGDWNPKYTEHWAFELEGQPHTYFTHTTYKDNPFCPPGVIREIESYEPTPANIAAGTADEWRWKVYGLGIRAAKEGLVYPNIDWIDEFPSDLERVVFGLDFGFTNDPTALVRLGLRGLDLYMKEEFYAPCSDPALLYDAIEGTVGRMPIFADSADKYAKNPESMVDGLLLRGLSVVKAKKYAGSVTDGIHMVKSFRLHIVRSRNFQTEANSYVWDSVNGITINQPIDKFNHLWDAVRYAVMEYLYWVCNRRK